MTAPRIGASTSNGSLTKRSKIVGRPAGKFIQLFLLVFFCNMFDVMLQGPSAG